MIHDVFICHASEDKESFVRPLAEALKAENIEVWYDEFSLNLGDSLRRSIDKGLRTSRFGVVVFSKAFLSKNWTQYELDGLVEREMAGEDKVLLPVWYKIDHSEVVKYSPSIAGRKAAIAEDGVESVVKQIMSVIHPQGSPLIRARDVLLEWGVTPPVITDEFWLDIVEASNRISATGAMVPEESVWDRWSFPLPWNNGNPESRGDRLAWTAMQIEWTNAAAEEGISPITSPELVVDFIDKHPGLYETCQSYPGLLAEYAPQLTIPGYGGSLETDLEAEYQINCRKSREAAIRNSKNGSGLTVTASPPLCDEEWIFRSPTYGDYKASSIANAYFSSYMFGPPISPYEHSEHLFWLLSDSSDWLPRQIHDVLLKGMSLWSVWLWKDYDHIIDGSVESDSLFESLFDCVESGDAFVWTKQIKEEVFARIEFAIKAMSLPDSAEKIMARFIDYDFTGKYISVEAARRSGRE